MNVRFAGVGDDPARSFTAYCLLPTAYCFRSTQRMTTP